MDRTKIIQMLKLLNKDNLADYEGDLHTLYEINVSEVYEQCNIDNDHFRSVVSQINSFNEGDTTLTWKYIELNYYFVTLLGETLQDSDISDVLSVEHGKIVKITIKNIISVGIACNLLANMPCYRKLNSKHVDDSFVLNRYNRLAGTTDCLMNLLKCIKLRSLILCDGLKPMLSSLYQLAYCPLKKPNESPTQSDFIMTGAIYNRLLRERNLFKKNLYFLLKYVHPYVFVRETMMLVEKSSPVWMKKVVSHNLSNMLKGAKGVEKIAVAMFDLPNCDAYDSTKIWRALDVFATLIVSLRNSNDFEENICKQLNDLLELKSHDETMKIFESAFVTCVKKLYHLDKKLCEHALIPSMTNWLHYFIDDYKFTNYENVTDRTTQSIRMLHSCLIGIGKDDGELSVELLRPVIKVVFNLYLVTYASPLKVLHNELQIILLKYLECDSSIFVAFDAFLFDIMHPSIKSMRNDILLAVKGDSLIVQTGDHKFKSNVTKAGEVLLHLCKNSIKLSVCLFRYLLNCLLERQKYFKTNSNVELLQLECDFVIHDGIERNLMVYQNLSTLAENKDIQNHISDQPMEIIGYVENVLNNTIQTKVHKTFEEESETFQFVFTSITILQALVMNTGKQNLQHFRKLLEPLLTLYAETNNLELKNLVKSVIHILNDEHEAKKLEETFKTEVEKAIEDVYDSLLPVRGHGLMTLTKLLEKRDKMAMERKQYILNIFQQSLKDEDSFIYLSAIQGLTAMCDIFPESVLNTLTDEYIDFSRKNYEDRNDIRMKLGEVLVRATKRLGEMAPKYKTILINTFLLGTKDDDFLIRASSLSNLAEVCRVLGYKLGSILTEVLVCVHAIITTDKAVEARRAAVTVIRQLFAGLESEMIAFLKDDILEIYRTLKNVYNNDNDDVMRLQAQLALEELNINMKMFVFPNPQLYFEKKIVMMN